MNIDDLNIFEKFVSKYTANKKQKECFSSRKGSSRIYH